MSIYDELFKISKEVNDAVAQQNKFVFVGATGFVIAMVLIYAYDLTLSNKYGTLIFLLALLGIFIAIMGVIEYVLLCLSGIQKSNALDSYIYQLHSDHYKMEGQRHDELMRAINKLRISQSPTRNEIDD